MRLEASCTDRETLRWPDWSGQTAVCIATGPSLTQQQVDTVRRASVRTIGINDIGIANDWIDIWYAADDQFWRAYSNVQTDVLRVCAQPQTLVHGLADKLLSVKDAEKARKYIPGYAISGGHSGFQALQLAISLGSTRVYLLGYDCKPKGNLTNYFGTKCKALHRDSDYKSWPQFYRDLNIPEGVEVLNATPGSAIDAYPRVDISCLA